MKQIKITISPEGEIKVEVSGVKGKSCTDLTRQLEAALGDTERSKKKPDYFAVAPENRRRGMIKT